MGWEEGVASRFVSPSWSHFFTRSIVALSIVFVAALAFPRSAWAAAEDARFIESINQTMTEDYPGNLGDAKRKVLEALDRCKGGRCSNPAKAQGTIALGMIQSQLGDAEGAKATFGDAMRLDARAKLPSSGVTPNIKQQWADAQAAVAASAAAAAAAAANPAPEEAPAAEPAPAAPVAQVLPPGWRSREAFDLANDAIKALQAGNFEECAEKNRKSLEKEDRPRTRLVLSRCEEKAGHSIDALKDAQKALELGIKTRDAELIKVARPRVEDLIKKMPHVTFVVPAGTTVAEVKFDDRNVPIDALTKKFSIDPGKHHVSANGLSAGIPGAFEQDVEVKEGELLTVRIDLQATPGAITKGQLDCLIKAKNDEEIKKCVEKSGKGVVVRVGLENSGYADTNHVYVYSPQVNAQVISPTAGWNVGGSYTLDIVTAASPDIVSEASHRFKERRHAIALGGGYKPGLYGVSANANFSTEPDYVSRGIGIAATADLRDKLITPRLGYNYSHDTIGRGGGLDTPGAPTSFDVYSKSLDSHLLEAGVTWVLSSTSILVTSLTTQLERGDQSKPYRYVPMFDPAIAGQVPVGATIDLVNRYRLPIRPIEQLPTERDRYAVGARFAKRMNNATLRLEERFYYDSWGTKATTTDGRYMMDLSRHFRVWPHVRFHGQSGTSFYNLAYSALLDPVTNSIIVPTYRTGDRELGPMVTITAGGGTRISLSPAEASTQFAVLISGDYMYSRFLNSLFVTTRSAVFGTVGVEAEFE